MRKGFTLIELLIVVAIIAILAAIAVPNFLEAQTRSKVARVKADERSVATALEAYSADNNKYPPGQTSGQGNSLYGIRQLTTPVTYMTSINLTDPFDPRKNAYVPGQKYSLKYFCYSQDSPWAQSIKDNAQFKVLGFRSAWVVNSWGPDTTDDAAEWYPIFFVAGDLAAANAKIYDPTNGTVSIGDVARYGGDLPVRQVP